MNRRVDHLAVPAAGFHAVAVVLFKEQSLPSVSGQCVRDGEAYDPGTDDGDVKIKFLHEDDSVRVT
jgi:hypothetical protein